MRNSTILLGIYLITTIASWAQSSDITTQAIKITDVSSNSYPSTLVKTPSDQLVTKAGTSGSVIGKSMAGAFSVSLSGAANYAIPFSLPAGTGGKSPNIGLAYSSQSSNGIAGWGWSISGLSVISRVGTTLHHDGYIDPVDFDSNDKYAMDGQRLLLKSGTYGTDGSEYQTENYTNIKVKAYGSTNVNGIVVPTYFIVFNPDGTRMWYGNETNSRSRFGWHLTRIQDINGNRINFKYSKASDVILIDEISYGTQSAVGMQKIKFFYRTRERTESSYINGQLVEVDKLLNRIEIFAGSQLFRKYALGYQVTSLKYQRMNRITESNGSNQKLPSIYFNYDNSEEELLVAERKVSIFPGIDYVKHGVLNGDFDGDGRSDLITYEKSQFQQTNKINIFMGMHVLKEGLFNSEFIEGFSVTMPKFQTIFSSNFKTSDGKISNQQGLVIGTYNDFNEIEFKTYRIIKQSDKLSLKEISDTTWSEAPYYNISDDSDINFADIITDKTYNDTNAFIKGKKVFGTNFIKGNSKITFGATESVTILPGFHSNYGTTFHAKQVSKQRLKGKRIPVKYVSGDFNGDGLTDLMAISQPYSYGGSTESCKNLPPVDCLFGTQVTIKKYEATFIDLNNANSLHSIKEFGRVDDEYASGDMRVGDFNGDGKSDLYFIKKNKIIVYGLDRNNNLIELKKLTHNFFNLDYPIRVGDFNGDGISDLTRPTEEDSKVWKFMIGTGTGWNYKSKDIDLYFNKSTAYEYSFQPTLKGNTVNGLYINPCPAGNRNCSDLPAIFEYYFNIIDINQDGKSDIIYHKIITPQDEQIRVSHQSIGVVSNLNFSDRAPEMKFTNFVSRDGDYLKKFGLPIFSNFHNQIRGSEYSYIVGSHVYAYQINKDNKTDMALKSITNNGHVTEIDYGKLDNFAENKSQSNDLYRHISNQTYPYIPIAFAPGIRLVKEVHQSAAGLDRKQRFLYEGAVTHATGLGFIGFQKVHRSNWEGDNMNTLWSTKIQDPELRGMTVKEWTTSGSFPYRTEPGSNFVSKNEYRYDARVTSQKVFINKLIQTKNTNGLNGVVKTEKFTYDPYNSVNQVLTTFLGGSNRTDFQYYNNPGTTDQNYYVGRIKNKKETATLGSSTFSTEETYKYQSNRLQELKYKGKDTRWITENYQYNGYGNMTQKSVKAEGLAARMTKYDYFENGGDLKKSTDIEGLETTFTYYTGTRYLKTRTNPYGQTTEFTYDTWGRLKTEKDYLGNTNTTSYLGYSDGSLRKITMSSLGGGEEVRVNRWGWKTLGQTRNTLNQWVYIKTEHDAIGRVTRESEPYLQSASKWTSNYYDAYGREKSKTLPSGRIVFYSYNGLSATVNDGVKTTTTTLDALGNIVRITDPGGTVKYTYHANGAMKTTDYDGHTITSDIDGWGRKKNLNDPAAGNYTYQYNDYGEVLEETTPKGATTYEYDDHGKLILKALEGDETDITTRYTYDPVSKLLKSSDSYDAENKDRYRYGYNYDGNNRPKTIVETTDKAKFIKTFLYDAKGRMYQEEYRTESYLSGQKNIVKIKSNFHPQSGAVYQLNDADSGEILWQVHKINHYGQVTEAVLGNQLKRKHTYDALGFPEHYKDTENKTNGKTVYELAMSFDQQRGNLKNRHYKNFSGAEVFTYDELDRLKNASGSYPTAQTYDARGRLDKNEQVGTYTYKPGTTYQLDKAQLNANGEQHYGDRALQQITYNAYKKPLQIYEEDQGRVDFDYGPGMQRSTAYHGGLDEDKTKRDYIKSYSSIVPVEIEYDQVTKATKIITYIGGDAYNAGIVHVKENGNEVKNEFYYLHRDHLGSILAISNSVGEVIEQTHYGAWGIINKHVRNGVETAFGYDSLLGRGYTGHEHFESVGLIHMNGRMYDAKLRRFLSPDNYIQDPYNTQSFNRFGYAWNNPLKYNDPSGEELATFLIIAIGSAVGAYLGGAVANGFNFNPFQWKWDASTWRGIVIGAVLGGLLANPIATGQVAVHIGFNVAKVPIVKLAFVSGSVSLSALGIGILSHYKVTKERDESGIDTNDEPNALDDIENGTTAPTSEVYVEGDYDDWVFTGESVTHSFTGTTSDGTNWLGHFQTGLDFIGLVPVFGEVADGINAIIYLSQGDYLNAGLSGAAMLPIGGQFATAGKFANKAYDLSKGASKFLRFGGDEAIEHFGKHGNSVMNALGKSSYNLKDYLGDANHVIANGTFVPELNGYVRMIGGQGSAKYGFVGLNRATGNITTFHIKTAKELSKKAPGMFNY